MDANNLSALDQEADIQVVSPHASSAEVMQSIPATTLPSSGKFPGQSKTDPWMASTRLLAVWMFPAMLALYLKWYMMAEQGGFAREARSMGLHSLSFYEGLSFFRTDLIWGGLAIPLGLILLSRFTSTRCAAILTGTLSASFSVLIGIQLLSLKEVGRFSSLKMIQVGFSWGWHEPGSGIQYLISRQMLIVLLSAVATGLGIAWAVKASRHNCPERGRNRWKTAGELYLFLLAAGLLLSLKSDVPKSAYHESSAIRAISSLWGESAVETGELAGLDLQRSAGLATRDWSNLSEAQLIARYHELTGTPVGPPDLRYFGKEKGANILFFILETTPAKYLPLDGDMTQFPNLGRLEANSLIGSRHYTTFPITRQAVFSLFSSWYPVDDAQDTFDSPSWDAGGDFLRRLGSAEYQTAAFSPLRAPGVPDEALFKAVGFSQQFYPESAIADYDKQASWKTARVAADVDTLHLLETHLDQWMAHGNKFAAAFLPQIGHSPYPDDDPGTSADELQKRGRAILSREDAWLGEIVNLLQNRGQLNNTIIVVLGDHGLRTITENPDLRRGTIDEIAFHVPLLIYAPRALDHTERIPWLTSHIDIVPTLLDLLGAKGQRDSEQGSAIWNPALEKRTTFFFAKPMFGADGYTSNGQFFMWHYFSDTLYEKSSAVFYPTDILPRRSATAREVTAKILDMGALEKAWHRRFADPTIHAANQSNPVPKLP
jgi:Sulfatase